MTFESAEFKALRDKWYAKLKKKGFKDIEQSDGALKIWDSMRFQNNYDKHTFGNKEEYYRLASSFAETHKFDSPFERKAWKFHSEGRGIRQIVSLFNKAHTHTYKYEVNELLKKLRAIMMAEQKKELRRE